MKYYLYLVFFLILPPCSLLILASQPTPPVVTAADPKDSSVRIKCDMGMDENGNSTTYWGTGTVIYSVDGMNTILTCAHVVDPTTKTITVIYSTTEIIKVPAKYVRGSKVTYSGDTITLDGPDLCIISMKGTLPAVTFAKEAPGFGISLFQYGYGGDTTEFIPELKKGKSVDIRAVNTLTTSIHTVEGDSGSGIFNTNNELIGVCWGTLDNIQYAVPLPTINKFLKNK